MIPFAIKSRIFDQTLLQLSRFFTDRSREPGVLILAYHDINPIPTRVKKRYIYTVHPEQFKWQMTLLREMGLPVVPLSQAVDRLSGKLPLEEKYVVITFDDGYHTFMKYALPVLKQLQLPATLFVTTGYLGQAKAFPWLVEETGVSRDFAAWQPFTREDIHQLGESEMVEIGSHTHLHRSVTEMDGTDYLHDVATSRRILQEILSREVVHFSYAYSISSFLRQPDRLRQLEQGLESLGFRSACTTLMGFNRQGANVFRLKRIQVKGYDSPSLFRQRLEANLTLLERAQRVLAT